MRLPFYIAGRKRHHLLTGKCALAVINDHHIARFHVSPEGKHIAVLPDVERDCLAGIDR